MRQLDAESGVEVPAEVASLRFPQEFVGLEVRVVEGSCGGLPVHLVRVLARRLRRQLHVLDAELVPLRLLRVLVELATRNRQGGLPLQQVVVLNQRREIQRHGDRVRLAEVDSEEETPVLEFRSLHGRVRRVQTQHWTLERHDVVLLLVHPEDEVHLEVRQTAVVEHVAPRRSGAVRVVRLRSSLSEQDSSENPAADKLSEQLVRGVAEVLESLVVRIVGGREAVRSVQPRLVVLVCK